jgi:uridine phosphorylase
LPRRGLLAATGLKSLRRFAPPGECSQPPLWGGLTSLAAGPDFFLAGPVLGAPLAVMTLEELTRRGAKEIIFVGLAGGLAPGLRPGDLFCPEEGLSTEGTSAHYPAPQTPDEDLRRRILAAAGPDERLAGGAVWSTDGPYRETAALIAGQRAKGAVAVDMETTALWAAARFRGCRLAALLVISDSLTESGHCLGFGQPRFRRGLDRAARLAWRAAASAP